MSKIDIPFGIKLYSLAMFQAEYIEEKMIEFGLERKQFLYLIFPQYIPGINQDSISSYFNADKSTTARTLQKLENVGLIYREKDRNNLRSNKVYLTEKGKEFNLTISQHLNEWKESVTNNVEDMESLKKDIDGMFELSLFSR